jgi:hypothetical protein
MRVAKGTSLLFGLVRTLAAALMAALPGLLAACASSGAAPAASYASHGSVITLNNIDVLKSRFNRDDGHTRLILIFSPT